MYIYLCRKTTKKGLNSGTEMIKTLMYQSYESYQNMDIACSEPDKYFYEQLKYFHEPYY